MTDEHPTGPIDVHEALLHHEHPLHRPRHGGRHRPAGVCALVFLLVPALAFVVGVRPTAFENRPLVSFPSPGDGWGFLGAMPLWASDHLPLRQSAVQAADAVSRDVFDEPFPLGDNARAAGPAGPVAPAAGAPVAPQSPANARLAVNDDLGQLGAAGYPAVVTGQQGWLYYGFDAYGACNPTRTLDDVVGRLGRLRAAVESSGRTLTLVVAPDKSGVVGEHLPDRYAGASCVQPRRAAFWTALTTRAGALDVRADLRSRQDSGVSAYPATDSHWTFDSGLLVTRSVAEGVAPGSTAGWVVGPGAPFTFTGDLGALAGSPTTFAEEVPRLEVGGADLTADPVFAYRTAVQLGAGPPEGTWSVVGDSFAQFLTPYITAWAPGSSLVHVETARTDPDAVAASMTGSRHVVVEVAERYLDSGVTPLLDDAFLASVVSAMAAHPVR